MFETTDGGNASRMEAQLMDLSFEWPVRLFYHRGGGSTGGNNVITQSVIVTVWTGPMEEGPRSGRILFPPSGLSVSLGRKRKKMEVMKKFLNSCKKGLSNVG